MNTPQTLLRADIAIALETYKGPRATQAVAFFAPGKEANWYFQLKAPALALKPLLEALHQPPFATGNLEVNADLHSTGIATHALIAGLSGWFGVGMANGTVDNRLLGSTLGTMTFR